MSIKTLISSAFNEQEFDNTVLSTYGQSDGKIIVAGGFTSWNSNPVGYIIRLNSDGTKDSEFSTNIGTAANALVTEVAVQSDGKILVAGDFTSWNGVSANKIVRLNSNGTLDTEFNTNIGTGPNNYITSVALQSDGKILVGGPFFTWNSSDAFRIVRLNSNGTRDADFTTGVVTGPNNTVQDLAVQSDGKILVVGDFTQWNSVTVNRIVRLNSNGTRDTAFTTSAGSAANNYINSVALQSDGKILVGGAFSSWAGTVTGRLVRLNSDGTRDTTFSTNIGTGANNEINDIVIRSDSQIIVGGTFTTWNSVTVGSLVLLSSSGIRDIQFSANVGTGGLALYAISLTSDNKIIIGTATTQWNGYTKLYFVLLDSFGNIYDPVRNAIPYAKVGSTWKLPKSVYNKVNGEWKNSFLAGGVNDSSFTTYDLYTGINSNANSIAIQSDGKIILAGNFSTFNELTVNRIVRLNSDGTQDTAFTTNTGTGSFLSIYAVAIQSDGKIVIGGGFTTFNGVIVNGIVRLNSDGTQDTAFTTNTGTAANSSVFEIAIQSDGKIILAGAFTTFNGVTVNGIVRLNSDGTQDTAFTTNTGAAANSLAEIVSVQSDGKILLGGAFTTFNGVTVNRIVRLNSDGTRDTAFTTNTGTGASDRVNKIAIQSDSKIVLVGRFSTFNGVTVNRIVRLNSDGTQDTAFTTNTGAAANATASSVAIQSDGKIIVTGTFSTWNGTTVNYIVRLNSDGTRDTTFTSNAGTAADVATGAIAIQSDGKIVLGGSLTTWNGSLVNRIVRLNSNGLIDSFFIINRGYAANGSVISLLLQIDGKILVGGDFKTWNNVEVNRIARLFSDGTLDILFKTNIGTGANSTVNKVAIQSDGKIILGGAFTTFNGVTVNRIVRLNPDGTQDTAFTSNTGTGANSGVTEISVQSDDKIILSGYYISAFNGVAANQILRLNSNGTRDTTFTTNIGTGPDDLILTVDVQSDGKILVGGRFENWNGTAARGIVRLNSNGTRDTTFETSLGAGSEVNFVEVFSTFTRSDGKVLVSVAFTTVTNQGFISLVETKYLVVLKNSDGTLDTNFSTNIGTEGANFNIYDIKVQEDGKILLGGLFSTWNFQPVSTVLRLNSDGTQDIGFTTNTGTGESGRVNEIAIQSDQKIIIGGNFKNFNGTVRNNIARLGGDFAG